MAGFGVPLSSIPNTSWMNVSEPVSSAGGFTGKAVGASSGMFDPLSLTMAGIGAIGNVVGGIFQGNAQQRAAQIQANAANVAALASLITNGKVLSVTLRITKPLFVTPD